jgi:hypothetical protein
LADASMIEATSMSRADAALLLATIGNRRLAKVEVSLTRKRTASDAPI